MQIINDNCVGKSLKAFVRAIRAGIAEDEMKLSTATECLVIALPLMLLLYFKFSLLFTLQNRQNSLISIDIIKSFVERRGTAAFRYVNIFSLLVLFRLIQFNRTEVKELGKYSFRHKQTENINKQMSNINIFFCFLFTCLALLMARPS